eukprot:g63159.t1
MAQVQALKTCREMWSRVGENHKRGPETKNYIEDQVKRRRKKSRGINGITRKLTLGAEQTGLSFVLLAVNSSGVQTIPIVGSKRHFDPASVNHRRFQDAIEEAQQVGLLKSQTKPSVSVSKAVYKSSYRGLRQEVRKQMQLYFNLLDKKRYFGAMKGNDLKSPLACEEILLWLQVHHPLTEYLISHAPEKL